MPNAEIVAIGTELLLGEIVDTNTQTVARLLRGLGIDLRHTSAVGDNESRIADAVRVAMGRADIVIASGGLGPTVDDVTREAVASALGAKLEFRPELWEQVVAAFRRFSREPAANNRRQAFIPAGAVALPNPVGTAPAFYAERDGGIVICLPGVPRELEHFLEADVPTLLGSRYPARSALLVRVLHTAGIGESDLDERLGDLLHGENPTIGLAAHPGQVDVRITAQARSTEEAEALLASTEAAVRLRLNRWVYGADGATLEGAVEAELLNREWRVAVCESGIEGALVGRLDRSPAFAVGHVLPVGADEEDLARALTALLESTGARVALGAMLRARTSREADATATIVVETPAGRRLLRRSFGGHPRLAPERCATLCLAALLRDMGRQAAAQPGDEPDDLRTPQR